MTDDVFERRTRRFAARTLRAVLLTALAACGAALAQTDLCHDALTSAADRTGGDPARVATAVARAAFDALEPAYPQRQEARAWDDPNAAWLDRRGWLPQGWREDALDPQAWASLLAGLQRPYGAEPVAPSIGATTGATSGETTGAATGVTTGADGEGASARAALVADAQAALANGAATVRPLALVATEDGDADRVAFVAVLWNWTPYPRLLLFPAGDRTLEDAGGPGELVAGLGTCAWAPRAWMVTREDAAADYYFGNVDAGLRLVATDRSPQRRDVPAGDERDVLRYAWEPMVGSRVAAVEFTGPGPGLGQVLGLLSSVRTNVGLFEVGHYLAFP